MTSLVPLAYLDKITKCIRPSREGISFAGIPVIITGDAFQLPDVIVNGKGILSNGTTIGDQRREIFSLFTEKVFFMRLSQNIRQGGDQSFAAFLRRLRLSEDTQNNRPPEH